MKIDVDGREPNVIKGAKKLLSAAKSILIEVNTNLADHLEMIKEIESLGFKFDQNQVDKSIRKEGSFKGCAEYLFTKTPELKIVKHKINKKKLATLLLIK